MIHFLRLGLGCLLCLAGWTGACAQQLSMTVEIERQHLGSGEPGQAGFENATPVSDDVYHAPQYMPGYPTARSVWARVIEVPCDRGADGRLQCKGYQWSPALGRGEYLFFKPVVLAATPQASQLPAQASQLPPQASQLPPPEPIVIRPRETMPRRGSRLDRN